MSSKTKTFLICIAIPLLTGGVSGFLTRNSMDTYRTLQQQPLSPPGFLFPIVWTILYILMGIASFLIVTSNDTDHNSKHFGNYYKNRALSFYALQLFSNLIWPILFFSCGWYLFSFFWLLALWLLILICIYVFKPVNEKAAYLMIPYFLWVTFAAYLNLGVYLIN